MADCEQSITWTRLSSLVAVRVGRCFLVYLVFAMVALIFAAFVVAAFSGFINLMNSVDGDSATEITS